MSRGQRPLGPTLPRAQRVLFLVSLAGLGACDDLAKPGAPDVPPSVGTVTQASTQPAACGGDTRCLAAQKLTDPTLRKALKIHRYDGGPLCTDPKQEERCQTDARRAIATLFDTRCGDFIPNDRPPLPTGVVFEQEAAIYDSDWVNLGGTVADMDDDGRDEYVDMGAAEIRVITGRGTTELGLGHASEPKMETGSRGWITYAAADGGKLRKADFGQDLRSLSFVRSGGKVKLLGVMDDWRVVSFDVAKDGERYVATNRKELARKGAVLEGRKSKMDGSLAFQIGSKVTHKPFERVESTVLDGRPVLVTMSSEWLADLDGKPPFKPQEDMDGVVDNGWRLGWDSGVPAFFVATLDFGKEEIKWTRVKVKNPKASLINGWQVMGIHGVESFTLEHRHLLSDGGVRSDPEPYVNLVLRFHGRYEPEWDHPESQSMWGRCKLDLDECVLESFAREGEFFESHGQRPGTVRMAVVSQFDYRAPGQREKDANNNLLFVYSAKHGKAAWGPSPQYGDSWRKSLPLGPRARNVAIGMPRRTVSMAGAPYAGDFFGRAVIVEKLMLEGKHLAFPTAVIPKLEMLMIPPPHWFALQDFSQANLDFNRSDSKTKESSYGSQVANGTSWQVGGGLRVPFASVNYTHDEEETKFTHTTKSTGFITSRTITRSTSVEVEPQVLVQLLCSDDFWYRVKRGTLPRLDDKGDPVRDKNQVLVRDPIEDAEQFLVVQVPRRAAAFFKSAKTKTGFAAQAAVGGELSPLLRQAMPLDDYNQLMLNLGQEWRQIELKRLIGYPPSYFEDRTTDDAQAKKYYDLNGKRKADVVVLGSHAVPTVGAPTVSWSVDDAVDENAMKQVMKGTTWSSSDRVHFDISLPFDKEGKSGINGGGGLGWTKSKSSEIGNGDGTGTHDSTRYSFSWNGWRLNVLRQDYFDQRLANEGVNALDQRRSLKEAGGYAWKETVGLKKGGNEGGEIVDIPFTEDVPDLSEKEDREFRNLLLARLNFTTTVYTYRHAHEAKWTMKSGPSKGKELPGKLEFAVLDYSVRWHRSNPPRSKDFPHYFPIRKRAAFKVNEKFCDFFRNQVVEVVALGDDGQPQFAVPKDGRCFRQFEGKIAAMCREDRAATNASCVRRASSQVKPKSVRTGPPQLLDGAEERLCTGGFVYTWDYASGDYQIEEACEMGCAPDGSACSIPPPAEEPEEPPTVVAIPECEGARETACYLDDTCCGRAGESWQDETSWSYWCEILSEGACSLVEPAEGVCGDGILDDPDEFCDDGNAEDGDGCSADCQIFEDFDEEPSAVVCGDGLVGVDEQCDDGNLEEGDGCDAECLIERVCGDGSRHAEEECDDGGLDDGDGCDSSCRFEAFCGNGRLDPGETCDDENTTGGDRCDTACQVDLAGWLDGAHQPFCGDGTEEGDALCPVEQETCGNGVAEGEEQCDDGNATESDTCTSTCIARPLLAVDVTGLGTVRVTQNGQTVCMGECRVHVAPLGDLELHAESTGNVAPSVTFGGASCQYAYENGTWAADCAIPVESLASNHFLTGGDEALRLFPSLPALLDVTFTRAPTCGDGVRSAFEECDDGNSENGDGCNEVCQDVPCPPGERVTQQQKRDGAMGVGCAVQPASAPRWPWLLVVGLVCTLRARRRR